MFKFILLVVLLVVGWSDVTACGINLDEPVVVNCVGCP